MPFNVSKELLNSVPNSIVASPYQYTNVYGFGTVWTLSKGVYVIDYELNAYNDPYMAIGIYTGSNSSLLTIDKNTESAICYSNVWTHGRAIEIVTTSLVIAISPVGPNTIYVGPTIYNDSTSPYMIRVTFLKIA